MKWIREDPGSEPPRKCAVNRNGTGVKPDSQSTCWNHLEWSLAQPPFIFWYHSGRLTVHWTKWTSVELERIQDLGHHNNVSSGINLLIHHRYRLTPFRWTPLTHCVTLNTLIVGRAIGEDPEPGPPWQCAERSGPKVGPWRTLIADALWSVMMTVLTPWVVEVVPWRL